MNKVLLAIVVIVLIFGGFLLLGKTKINKTSTPTNTPVVTQISETKTIKLTKDGFSPKELNIKVGTKVIWENESGNPATVNSNNHPTHLLYPFLNLGEFANGQSLSVVFDKAGKYGYHNHLNPTQTGTIEAK